MRKTASATEPTSNLPMGPGECVPHYDAVDVALGHEAENLVGGQTGTHHHLTANAGSAYAFGQGRKMMRLGTRRRSVVVVANP